MLCEAFYVRDNELFAERLDEHGRITTDALTSYQLARGNVDIYRDFVGSESVGRLETRAS